MTFAQRLKQLRCAHNLSQAQVAEKMGIYSSYITRLETGELDNPTISTVRKVAQIFNLSLSQFMKDVE